MVKPCRPVIFPLIVEADQLEALGTKLLRSRVSVCSERPCGLVEKTRRFGDFTQVPFEKAHSDETFSLICAEATLGTNGQGLLEDRIGLGEFSLRTKLSGLKE